MRIKKLPVLSRVIMTAMAAMVPGVTMAAGFQLTEQSVTGLGRAFAGSAAIAEDATTIFFNPAGLTELEGTELMLGASVIILGADFDREVAVDATGQPLTGGEGGDVGKPGAPPFLYFARPINDEWTFGLGVNAPFGLSTDYDPDWVGRYQGVYSNVTTLNLNPSLGWKINDNWSLGFGLNAMHMRVKLTNIVDYGIVCYNFVNPVTCNGLGLNPQQHDGYAEIEGDRWGFGFNVGVLWKNDATRIGLHYRSEIDHDLEGDARFENAPAVFTATHRFINQGIQADFTTPQTLSLSVAHDINEQFTISGDVTWTGWDSFEEIRVNFDNYDPETGSGQPPTVQPENWKNVMRYSLGLDWRYDPKWTFRAGLAYDETPVSDETRTPRLPDADRTWLALGASWQASENLRMDFGYAHLFLDDDIVLNEVGASMQDTLIGTYEASADIFGAALRYQF